MSWQDYPPPKDRPVWLFLPSYMYTTDKDGVPQGVQHVIRMAAWSDQFSGFVSAEEPGVVLYGSLWHDGGGDKPEMPYIGGQGP